MENDDYIEVTDWAMKDAEAFREWIMQKEDLTDE